MAVVTACRLHGIGMTIFGWLTREAQMNHYMAFMVKTQRDMNYVRWMIR